jgi:hypothetical protein
MAWPQGTTQVGVHGREHPRQQLLGFGEREPADLRQLVLLSYVDVELLRVGGPRGEVDHVPAGLRMDSAAEDATGDDLQPGLLLHFPRRAVAASSTGRS